MFCLVQPLPPLAAFDSVAWTLEFCIAGGFWALLGGFLPVISGRVCVLVRLAGLVVFWVAFSDPSLQPVLSFTEALSFPCPPPVQLAISL
ncbi:hypothetical protein U1Q18_002550 [Sarracenia purpurea var. burkii]